MLTRPLVDLDYVLLLQPQALRRVLVPDGTAVEEENQRKPNPEREVVALSIGPLQLLQPAVERHPDAHLVLSRVDDRQPDVIGQGPQLLPVGSQYHVAATVAAAGSRGGSGALIQINFY